VRYTADAPPGCDRLPGMPRNPSAVAPFFSLARAAWIPYALTWDPETGALCGADGPRGFASYREAVEASRFLALSQP
jgi:hypothetical protein